MQKKPLVIGGKAPDFTLKDETGAARALSDTLKEGPVVLIFYPGDLTPGCTIQLSAARNAWQDFQDLGIHLYAISSANAASHARFAELLKLPFPLLVDSKLAIAKKYSASETRFLSTVTKRMVYGISSDGILRYIRRGMPKQAEVLKAMRPYARVPQK
ncbi:peroxiredoxin [Candidatus Uhrbacteria bacterium CG22_combo_CG10-13_8_21_14_all_47_17]|uniref:thioredoxin-dependent peroxiredoxin n=1 Tax=Candidatus Uhrbacteria bacterium CG22_combo_CG10-13_8_21_14_all_47_17 TaxID=1975041 RepID=A0A2H0BS64_9BACT|nr:MAG: peroxiredoxin [Candidatus Uhrbacteria bacterium CG22_combo_CG10-13_8_21_14_all_47_17]